MEWISEVSDSAFSPPAAGPRWKILAGVLEASMWVASIVALGLAGWMWLDSELYQMRGRAELESAAAPGSPEVPVAPPAEGTPIASLAIPRLGLEPVVVAEGSSPEVLRRAVGHLPPSAMPGTSGNVVLAGHRDTFFRPLAGIRAGDLITLESTAGRDEYEVQWTKVVEPTAADVTEDVGYPALTLITCYPFRYVGSAPRRFVVRARRVNGR